ncbi:hypothetical protein HMPREF1317_1928 [Schaalia georgiae F0490]|uniref:Methyltransferase domain protein n=2 Tax=Schaalia georgiae TaxID=52768 RepID=J1GVD1_9ACTO|nr:hypothetical protein HMPREF1317_1928 [Schaalia georgiae F0490]
MRGWDFSVLEGAMVCGEPDWDFEAECRGALVALADAGGGTVLDMGTGGGKRLALLLDSLDAGRRSRLDIVATEGWERNVPVARERLEPLGVRVEEHDPERGAPLPFPDGGVRLVMNCHEALDARDMARVLAPGGLFVSEQVDGTDAPEVHDWFGTRPAYPDVRPAVMADALRGAGWSWRRPRSGRGPWISPTWTPSSPTGPWSPGTFRRTSQCPVTPRCSSASTASPVAGRCG